MCVYIFHICIYSIYMYGIYISSIVGFHVTFQKAFGVSCPSLIPFPTSSSPSLEDPFLIT